MTARRKTPPRPRSRALGEFERIGRLVAHLPPGEGVVVGPGDDAAVLRPRAGWDLVATTDAFVEGVHWDPALVDAGLLGSRLAIANLSDLVAMAAEPRWALLSAGLAPGDDIRTMEAVQRSFAAALAAHGASVVGGNLARTRGASWWSVTLLGEVPHGRAWTRFGARPGDLLAVTGHLGRAGAALRLWQARGARVAPGASEPLLRAYLSPPVRVPFARKLAEAGAVTAAIDVSDGFAGDLAHLCEASGVGALVEETALPADPALDEAARGLLAPRTKRGAARPPSSARLAALVRELRFAPSDDYELLLAVDPAGRRACVEAANATDTPLAFVGRFTDAPGVLTLRAADGAETPLPGGGWDHFGRTARTGRTKARRSR